MPMLRYTVDGGPVHSIAHAYVFGTVSAVDPGPSPFWERNEDGQKVRVEREFNDPEAMLSIIHVTIDAERLFLSPDVAPDWDESDPVTIGLALPNPVNIDAVRADLVGASLATLLDFDSIFFDYDDDVHGLIRDEFLGRADGEDIVFPTLDLDYDDQPDRISIEDLEADGPAEPIEVHRDPDTGAYSIR